MIHTFIICLIVSDFHKFNPSLVAPIPKMAMVIVWVKGTGNPKEEAMITSVPLVKETILPCKRDSFVIFLALVSKTFPPNNNAPRATKRPPQK